jgi:hypothetical protein
MKILVRTFEWTFVYSLNEVGNVLCSFSLVTSDDFMGKDFV